MKSDNALDPASSLCSPLVGLWIAKSNRRRFRPAKLNVRKALLAVPVLMLSALGSSQALATVLYSQGFEADTSDWTSVNRVASGTDGITSASGSYYGQAVGNGSSYSYWGGVNASTGYVNGTFVPYTTSLDIYLDVDGNFTNNTRFDFDSSISKPDGTFLRDFAFNAGFYNDATGPGGGTNRFVISAGNNSQPGSAYAKDPGHDPIAIDTSGWYTFQQDFTDNAGVLDVLMSILDSGGNLVHQWSLSNPADLTASIAGGSRYGWIDYNQFPFLAVDNASLKTNVTAVPGPATILLFASGLGIFGLLRRRAKTKMVAEG
jgi:hypothetical protein